MSYLHLVTTDGISVQHVAFVWPLCNNDIFFNYVASLLNNGHDVEMWLSKSRKATQ